MVEWVLRHALAGRGGGLKERVWRKFAERHDVPSPPCRQRVDLTGAVPSCTSEMLIGRVSGGRSSIGRDELEARLAEALYDVELRNGGWVLDIGIWGCGLFRKEAARLISNLRPEFGVLVSDGEVEHQ